MLDAGIQLEPERARLVQALSQTAPDQWPPQDVQRLKEGMDSAVSGIPQKRIFGSDYPYRDGAQHLGLSSEGVGLEASLALGGFSTVWAPPCCRAWTATWPTGRSRYPKCKAAAILSGMAQFLFQDFWTWKLRTHLAGVQNNRPLTAS